MPVEYNISLVNANSSALFVYSMSINHTGTVPLTTNSFFLYLNCKPTNQTSNQFYDIVFNISFKLKKKIDPSISSIDLQLITLPKINLSIHYRKYCTKKTINLSPTHGQQSNFAIAYFIFGILLTFSIVVLLACVYMYAMNRSKFRKSISMSINTSNHSKYESLNKRCSRTDSENRQNSSQFTKNPQIKKTRQVNQSVNRSQNTLDEENESNIYETVADVPVTTNRTLNRTRMLNLTTNTIQSTSVPNMSVTTSRKNSNQVELCARYRPEQVEIGSVKMEGTFSKIFNGILKKNQLESSQNDTMQNETEIKVMIKKINANGSQEQVDCMLRESCMFRGLKHKNLSTVIGICMNANQDDIQHPMVLFNNFEIGNLKMYFLNLRKKRKNSLKKSSNSNIESDEQVNNQTINFVYFYFNLF